MLKPGGPRAHRERVDRHERRGPERVAGEEPDVAMRDLALACGRGSSCTASRSSRSTRRSSCPGRGPPRRRSARAGRSGRRTTSCRSRAGGRRIPSGNRRCDVDARLPRGSGRTPGHAGWLAMPPAPRADSPIAANERRRRGGEEGLQPAVAEADRPEHRVEREQPDAAPKPDEGGEGVTGCTAGGGHRAGAPLAVVREADSMPLSAGRTRPRPGRDAVVGEATAPAQGRSPARASAWMPRRVDRGAARSGGQVGQRLIVEDRQHRVADVEHHVAERARRLVRARALRSSSGGSRTAAARAPRRAAG